MSYKITEALYLITPKVSQHSGVTYKRGEKETETNGRTLDENWRTDKHVKDVDEVKEIANLYSYLTRSVAKLSYDAPFGLVVPAHEFPAFQTEVKKLAKECADRNKHFDHGSVEFTVYHFKIEPDNQAITELKKQFNEQLQRLVSAIDTMNLKEIEEILNESNGLEKVADSKIRTKVKTVIDSAKTLRTSLKRQARKKSLPTKKAKTRKATVSKGKSFKEAVKERRANALFA